MITSPAEFSHDAVSIYLNLEDFPVREDEFVKKHPPFKLIPEMRVIRYKILHDRF